MKPPDPAGHWPRQAHTADGTGFRIRPLRPDDAERERSFIRDLSEQSRYRRFMHGMREASDALIEQLLDLDYRQTMALVAVVGEGALERIIGVARYCADNDTECEFAVVIADDWQCRGIGTALTPLLFEYAAHAGFSTIYGTVLADNRRMIEFAQWLGLTVDPQRQGEPTVRVWRRIGAAKPL